jgi:hypothetical protein
MNDRRRRIAALGLLVLAGLAGSARPSPAADPAVASVPPFQLRNGFWINLHHFLYQRSLPAEKGAAPADDDAALGPEERKAWSQALAFYRASIAPHDVFERNMMHIDYTLADLEGAAAPSRAPLAPELAAAYRAPWPSRPILVDVVSYANWAGGYTAIGDPMHTVITSADAGYQGFAALEMLFHEASHALLDGRTDPVTRAIERECRAQGKAPPRNLTHAVIFYTAGEIARRTLADVGVAGYVPVVERNGLWARAWPRYKDPIERFWLPYLDGKASFDAAIAQIVGTLPAANAVPSAVP